MMPIRRGQLSPMMQIVLGVMLLIAVLVVIFSLRDKSSGILSMISGLFS